MKKLFSISILFLAFLFVQSQTQDKQRVDSLLQKLNEFSDMDTNRMRTLVVLASAVHGPTAKQEEKDKSIEYINEAQKIADSLNSKNGKLGVYSFLGVYYQQSGNLSKSLSYNLDALKLAEELNKTGEVLRIKNVIGGIYFSMNDDNNALKFFADVLEMAEKVGNERSIAQAQSNIGIAYHRKKEYGKALEYYTLCLRTSEKSKNMRTKAHVLNSMGRLFFDMAAEESDAQTKTFYNQSIEKALNYYNQSLAIKRELKDSRGIANTLGNIAVVYKDLGQYDKSLQYYSEGEKIAEQIDYIDWLKEGYGGMSEMYEAKGDYKNALIYYKKFKDIIDTLQSATVKEEMTKLQGQYNTEKMEKENEALKKQQELSDENSQKKNIIIYLSVGSLAIVMVFAFFLFRGYKEKQKINLIIEEKNKNITDSIVYAKRIQTAILPSDDLINEKIKNYFIFYKPKDIVSGDFYFFAQSGDKTIFAVADCTGHGVPGAFMSMIGNSLLNQIIKEKGICCPSEILDMLHAEVRHSLKQNEGETNDGMDIAICSIDFKNKKLEYAGANRSLILVSGNELKEIGANKFPIGGVQTDKERKFTNHEISVSTSDTIYFSTDGFADQFGGPEGKKFQTKRFKELLQNISSKSIADQKIELESTMHEWMKNAEQLDDILVAGIKI